MGLIVFFRKTGSVNQFRDYLHALTSLPGETLYLTSGFIAEGPSFSLTDPKNMLPHILKGIQQGGLKEIVIIAGKFNTPFGVKSRHKFLTFTSKLTALLAGKATVTPVPQNNWHAKVAIKIYNGRPVAAIIGSSNLTTTAYGTTKGKNFNQECDVVIWDNFYSDCNSLFMDLGSKEAYDRIFFENITGKLTEKKRLEQLLSDLKKAAGLQ